MTTEKLIESLLYPNFFTQLCSTPNESNATSLHLVEEAHSAESDRVEDSVEVYKYIQI